MKRTFFPLFFIAILLACTLSTKALAWDGAIGLTSVNLGDDFGDLIDDGLGLSLQTKNRFSNLLAVEFLLDLSFHEDKLINADANYTRLDGGIRLFLLTTPSLDVYGAAGLSYHSLQFPDYSDEIDGFSIYLGAGVEFPVSRNGAIDISGRYHDWRADWDAGPYGHLKLDATTTVIDAVYVFKGI